MKNYIRIFVFIIGGLLGVYLLHLIGGVNISERLMESESIQEKAWSNFEETRLIPNTSGLMLPENVTQFHIDYPRSHVGFFDSSRDLELYDYKIGRWFLMDVEGWVNFQTTGDYSDVISVWIPESVELRIFPLEELEELP